jgi:hypothetical protein
MRAPVQILGLRLPSQLSVDLSRFDALGANPQTHYGAPVAQ